MPEILPSPSQLLQPDIWLAPAIPVSKSRAVVIVQVFDAPHARPFFDGLSHEPIRFLYNLFVHALPFFIISRAYALLLWFWVASV
ncbi:hypothetical protein [Desulfobotulus alkaliphilus]|uniref:hypothetical protein n=1 Tax=Desulfobotulus alkaliphilus TaxID=622671 RepID=UPI0011A4D6A3|nr:hypothetical protein [Desulfobotulus alkaliphilus]